MDKQKPQKLLIPFSPFPPVALKKITSGFLGIGESIAFAFPYLELHLRQAEIGLKKEEYGAIMFFLFIFYFAIVAALMLLISMRFFPKQSLMVSLTVGGIAGFLILIQLSVYPAIIVKKKVRDIERNLVFALRTMLIEVKSGVSLFNAMTVIAEGDYGMVSQEIRKAVEEIETGTEEETALQSLAAKNPSLFFRKAVWQLVNSMKAGADVAVAMQELVSSMGKEQMIEINRYGGSLRLLSLIYMMIGVIMPAMGMTLLIILSSFPQMRIGNELFLILLFVVVVMEFMYIGMIKSKRPNLIGG